VANCAATRQRCCARARRGPAQRVTRYLSASLWDDVKVFAAQLPQATDARQASAALSRWLMTLFYLQGLRISEVTGGRSDGCRRSARAAICARCTTIPVTPAPKNVQTQTHPRGDPFVAHLPIWNGRA